MTHSVQFVFKDDDEWNDFLAMLLSGALPHVKAARELKQEIEDMKKEREIRQEIENIKNDTSPLDGKKIVDITPQMTLDAAKKRLQTEDYIFYKKPPALGKYPRKKK
jgi:hypothetical protein